jgi:hypothetical protein
MNEQPVLHGRQPARCAPDGRNEPAPAWCGRAAPMSAPRLARLGSVLLVLLCVGCSRQVSFKNDVDPILKARCLSCHAPGGEGYEASGFSVETYQSVMKGTRYGPVIEPGSSIGSTLTRLIEHAADPSIAMPKSHHPGMTSEYLRQEQIDTIKKWIDQGAKDN